jgi:deoxyribodipyrimidine photo-lyase
MHGRFVRKWLPYMRKVPNAWLYEPWRMTPDLASNAGLRLGTDIIEPIVDLGQATHSAKGRLHGRRKQPSVRAAKKAVIEKHASRAPISRDRNSNAKSTKSPKLTAQLGFDF